MTYFHDFIEVIKRNPISESDRSLPHDLLMCSEGSLSIYYAPFDYVNRDAKIVICGITPGLQQAILALREAKKHLYSGASIDEVRKKSKEAGSFGGPIRVPLIKMLDHIGINEKLGIESCQLLFSIHSRLVHNTSALRYPVFLNGRNYNGTPKMISNSFLRSQMTDHLVEEIKCLPDECVYIPLGNKVTEVFLYLATQGIVNSERVLYGLPHPSGENLERINYFLGLKKRENLSKQTVPQQIDDAKAQILEKVATIWP